MSSWEMLCSEVPVIAVVVSPQLSSYERKRETTTVKQLGYFFQVFYFSCLEKAYNVSLKSST